MQSLLSKQKSSRRRCKNLGQVLFFVADPPRGHASLVRRYQSFITLGRRLIIHYTTTTGLL